MPLSPLIIASDREGCREEVANCRPSLMNPIAKHERAIRMTRLRFSACRHGTSKRLRTTKGGRGRPSARRYGPRSSAGYQPLPREPRRRRVPSRLPSRRKKTESIQPRPRVEQPEGGKKERGETSSRWDSTTFCTADRLLDPGTVNCVVSGSRGFHSVPDPALAANVATAAGSRASAGCGDEGQAAAANAWSAVGTEFPLRSMA